MGSDDDEGACVDNQLRVKGVSNLRIVDASVFPYTPSAFPVLPIAMLALKAADMISADASTYTRGAFYDDDSAGSLDGGERGGSRP